MLKRSIVTYGYCVRQEQTEDQLPEVLWRFDLWEKTCPFQRCLRCNSLTEPVAKAVIDSRLLPKTRRYYHEFRLCPTCDRLYWSGSHYQRLQAFIEKLQAPVTPAASNIEDS